MKTTNPQIENFAALTTALLLTFISSLLILLA